jgi:hypothetical protein
MSARQPSGIVINLIGLPSHDVVWVRNGSRQAFSDVEIIVSRRTKLGAVVVRVTPSLHDRSATKGESTPFSVRRNLLAAHAGGAAMGRFNRSRIFRVWGTYFLRMTMALLLGITSRTMTKQASVHHVSSSRCCR